MDKGKLYTRMELSLKAFGKKVRNGKVNGRRQGQMERPFMVSGKRVRSM